MLGITNLFLISTLVSDICGKQESVKTGETVVGMRFIHQVQRVGSWESQELPHVGHRLGELREAWFFMTVFPRNNTDTLPIKTCCVFQLKNEEG